MRVTDDPDRGISDRQAVRSEEQRIPLVAARCGSAQRVDILIGGAHSRNCDVSCATAVHETSADDHAWRIANDVGALGFVRAESFQKIEDLRAAEIGHLPSVTSELHAQLPGQVLCGVRPRVQRDLHSLVRQRGGVLERAEEASPGSIHRDWQDYVARFLVVADDRQIDFLIQEAKICTNFKLFLQLGTQRWIAESGAAGDAGNAANRAAQHVAVTRPELDYSAQRIERGVHIRLTTGFAISRTQLAETE